MEGLFCGFSDFFTQPQEKHTPQNPNEIGQTVAQFEEPAAQQPEISRRAQEDGRHNVKAHFAAAGGGGVDKQGDGDHQPEQQVQHSTQQGEADAHTEDAERVVQQPHRRPHHQRPGKEEGLVGDGYGPPALSRPLSS